MNLLEKIQIKRYKKNLLFSQLKKGNLISLTREKFNKKTKKIIGRVIKVQKTKMNIMITVIYLIKKHKIIEMFPLLNSTVKDITIFNKYKQLK